MRILLTAYAAIACGATFCAVLGSAAAICASHLPGGTREGANAIAGFFLIGDACCFLGVLLGGWLTWRVLADPNRTGIVAMALTGVLVVLGLGIMVATRPTGRPIVDSAGQTTLPSAAQRRKIIAYCLASKWGLTALRIGSISPPCPVLHRSFEKRAFTISAIGHYPPKHLVLENSRSLSTASNSGECGRCQSCESCYGWSSLRQSGDQRWNGALLLLRH